MSRALGPERVTFLPSDQGESAGFDFARASKISLKSRSSAFSRVVMSQDKLFVPTPKRTCTTDESERIIYTYESIFMHNFQFRSIRQVRPNQIGKKPENFPTQKVR